MNRLSLTELDDPKYLLYPNPWGFRTIILLPVIVFVLFLPWFIKTVINGETIFWHWIFMGFLGLITYEALRPKSWDWRQTISFAADTRGIYFVTEPDGSKVSFVPWEQVGEIRKGSVQSSNGSINGIIFKIKLDQEEWRALRGGVTLLEKPPDEKGYREIGISCNLRMPKHVLQHILEIRQSKHQVN